MKNIKMKCLALFGLVLVKIVKFGWSCLLNYTIYKFNRGGIKMANTFWASLGQICIAALASYGSAKVSNEQTSWVPYRNQLLASVTQVALVTAVSQASSAMQTQQSQPELVVTHSATESQESK